MKRQHRDYIPFACAYCLEDAGGRQLRHGIPWHVNICPCCGHRRSLADVRDFGAPPLQAKELPLTEGIPHEPR